MIGSPQDDTPKAPQTDPFRTDHLLENIGHRAVSGGFVTFGAQATKMVLNIGAAAVLARLLSPRDFGLVGMVLAVTAVVGVFKELGLSTATVQRDTITQEQVSNLFWINVVFSCTLAAICMGLAPLAASFYRDSRVTAIMLALSATFVLTGSTVQHQALLARQMRFQAMALIDVTSIAVGYISACVLAWLGAGYWALVAQQLMTAGCALPMTWLISRWRPRLPSRQSGVRPLVTFGAHLSLADFIARFAESSDGILLGRYFGAAPLGLYSRAQVLLARPIQQVLTPINSVLIPVLSRLQSDPERYRRSYMRAYGGLALVVFSLSAVCVAMARPIVLVILGPKWTGVIPLVIGVAMAAISGPLSLICAWIYESQGRGAEQLRNHSISGLITILAYLIGLHWGPLGLLISLAIIGLTIRQPIIYFLAGRRGHVRTRDLWGGFFSHLPCWAAVFLPTWLAYRLMEGLSPLLQLLVCIPVGLGIGFVLVLLFPSPRRSALFVFSRLGGIMRARLGTS
ncbi:MAG TPA: lipopolysaccharide biosynthesis protein [Terracidiphilus sp.]|nr:lipopolysaccharide biosynthesis protein [Terracidiphilus sp.]